MIMKKVNHLDYLVIAMMRSGYHAVLYWLFKSMKQNVHFYNNCCCDLRKEHSQMEGTLEKFPGEGKTVTFGSMEDFPINLFKRFKQNVSLNDSCKLIIVYRDPFNWIASSLKAKDVRKRINMFRCWKQDQLQIQIPPRINIYEIMMREVYLQKRLNILDKETIKINFVKWFRDGNYRERIAHSFGCDPSPDVDFVSKHGKGSSFSGTKIRGSQLDVLNRYKKFKNDKKFKKLISHPNMYEFQKAVMEE